MKARKDNNFGRPYVTPLKVHKIITFWKIVSLP